MSSANVDIKDLVGEGSVKTQIDSLKGLANFSGSIETSNIVASTSYVNEKKSFAENVVEFNRRVLKIDQRPIGLLNQQEYEISCKCLYEEIKEFQEAYEKGDIIGMIDAITDLKYFGDGVLYKMGLTSATIDKVGYAVHSANMEKKLGINARRGDGSAADAVKPTDWVSPEQRISLILDEQE